MVHDFIITNVSSLASRFCMAACFIFEKVRLGRNIKPTKVLIYTEFIW